jgi:hypothetical protein
MGFFTPLRTNVTLALLNFSKYLLKISYNYFG